jgi:hypothetical protein
LEGEKLMENIKFPVVIKKRNGFMIGIAAIEIIIGIVFGIIEGEIKSIPMWIFIFVGIVSALTVWGEYSQDIILKENNLEFYKNNDLIKNIKYNNIKSISINKGNDSKTQKKDFLAINYNNNSNKNEKYDTYLINLMNYSSQDFITIKSTILIKNSSVEVNDSVSKFIK